MLTRPKTAYQGNISVTPSHHILIWVSNVTYVRYMFVLHLHVLYILGAYVLTRCHVVTDINYVDRGAVDPRRCSLKADRS